MYEDRENNNTTQEKVICGAILIRNNTDKVYLCLFYYIKLQKRCYNQNYQLITAKNY